MVKIEAMVIINRLKLGWMLLDTVGLDLASFSFVTEVPKIYDGKELAQSHEPLTECLGHSTCQMFFVLNRNVSFCGKNTTVSCPSSAQVQ